MDMGMDMGDMDMGDMDMDMDMERWSAVGDQTYALQLYKAYSTAHPRTVSVTAFLRHR